VGAAASQLIRVSARPKAGERRAQLLLALAAALAALGESGLFSLLVMELASESVRAHAGPMATPAAFVPIFVGGATVGVLVRRSAWFTWTAIGVAVVLGLVQALVWGDRNAPGTAGMVVLALLVTVRVVTLAMRNWHDPIKESFAWGMGALLIEILLDTSASARWRELLPVVAVVFVLASLASRWVSLSAARALRPPAEARGAPRPLVAVALLVVLAVVMAGAIALGGPEGGLRHIGAGVYGVFVLIISGLAFAVAKVLLGPINWVFVRLHVNLTPLQEVSRRLSHIFARGNAKQQHLFGPAWLERILGLAFLGAVAWFLTRSIRLRWPEIGHPERTASESPEGTGEPSFGAGGRFRMPRRRRELPVQAVRRMYAEALLALERRGLPKPPATTPAEYVTDVESAIPEAASRFRVLTRAYEEVRYGAVDVPSALFRDLTGGHGRLLETIRRSERVDAEDRM
jgi:hypothetical protein